MDSICRANMKDLTVTMEEVPEPYKGLGGRGLTSAIVHGEVPPTCHPLGPSNKLVIATGLLSGTTAPSSGRLSAGGKSPLTGTIKESNAGGTASAEISRLGIAAIVVENQPTDGALYTLVLTPDGAQLVSADALKGMGNYDAVAKLTEDYGEKASYITIGPAGEMKLAAASIAVTDRENRPTRHAGRGGLGAVMGSKGLKAIVVDSGDRKVSVHDPDACLAAARRLTELLGEHPVTGEGLPTYGTNVLANVINEAGAYPTRNFSDGNFEGTEKISGETQRDTILEREGTATHACLPGCVMRCSRIYNDENGEYLTKGPEYETVWAHGADCGIDDLDAIAQMDRLDDDYGLDTIEMGVAIGVAMAAGVKAFGDAQGAIELLHEVGKGTPLGRILGSGAEVTGRVFGVPNVPVVKGQGIPAYDPRGIKGIGVTYATSTMGADHTVGYSVAPNILKVGGDVDPLRPEGQADLSRGLQIATAALDCTGLCLFTAFCILDRPEAMDAIRDMLNAKYDWELSADDISALGQKVLKIEREFNAAAGFTAADDRLPDFFKEEPLAPHNVVFDVPDEDLDAVFNF
ncbi:MAG: aldehyde ferredoxin oxidoreductase C-terminal domain-containing protein [Planctomycetota bacterium]|nr:aldehyde ferredoxin oxidoreductase C-terminal domain-containing protein [Planctomycetota bacterium]